MRIESLDLENYGIFGGETPKTFDFSRGNFHLVYGRNEAGKSTLHNFICNALFGGDSRDAADVRPPYSLGESRARGSLSFRFRDGSLGIISREWNLATKNHKFEFVRQNADYSETLTEDELRRLFSGVDRSLFSSYFGFSYATLALGADKLKRSDIRRLYYGMMYDSLSDVQKYLDERIKKEFTPDLRVSSKKNNPSRIFTLLDELGKAEANTRSGACRRYEDKKQEHAKICAEVDELTSQISEQQRELDRRSRLCEAWEPFQAYEKALIELRQFDDAVDFTQEQLEAIDEEKLAALSDRLAKRSELSQKILDCKKLLSEAEKEKERLEGERAAQSETLEREAQITSCAYDLKGYEEKSNTCRETEEQLKELEEELREGLVRQGVAPQDASDEEYNEAFERWSRLVPDSVVERVRREANDERERNAEVEKVRVKLQERRNDVDDRRADYLSKRSELKLGIAEDDFLVKERDSNKAREIFDDVLKALDEQRNARRDVENEKEKSKRQAVELARSASSEPPTKTETEIVDELSDAVPPLSKELDDLVAEENELAQRITELTAEIRSLREKLYELETYDGGAVERLESELKTAFAERDKLWNELRDAFLGTDLEPNAMPELVELFENALRRVDELNDKRVQSAKSAYEYEEKRREKKRTQDRLAKLQNELNEIEAKREAFNERKVNFWRVKGFECCVSIKAGDALEWTRRWSDWKKTRDALDEKEERLNSELENYYERISEVVELVAFCFPDSKVKTTTLEEPPQFEFVSQTALDVQKLLETAEALVERESKAFERLKNARLELRKAEAKRDDIEETKTELTSTADSSAEVSKFCDEVDLYAPESAKTSFVQLEKTLEQRRLWTERYNKRRKEAEKLDEKKKWCEKFSRDVLQLAEALEPGSKYGSISDYVNRLHEKLRKVQEIERALNAALAEYNRLESEHNSARKELDEIENDLNSFMTTTKVGRDDLESFSKASKKRLELSKSFYSKKEILNGLISGVFQDASEALAILRESTKSALEDKKNELEIESSELTQKRDIAIEARTKLDKEVEEIEKSTGDAIALQNKEGRLRGLRDVVNEYAPLIFARDVLIDFLGGDKDSLSEALGEASKFFSIITSERYQKIREEENLVATSGKAKSTDSGVFKVFDKKYEKEKTIDQLSVGTREQLYLALRLAHIKQYCEKNEPMPIFADDVMVNFDAERARRTIEVFRDYASDERQVVLLTCREDTRRVFEQTMGEEYTTIL